MEFLNESLKQLKILEKFEDKELTIISEFHIYNLIFAKEKLKLNDEKCTILLNIFWQLLIFNCNHYLNDEDDNLERILEKTPENDFKNFKKILANHCVDNPPNQYQYFSSEEAESIIDYVRKGYVDYFNLYNYALNNKQKNEEIHVTIYVDHPLPVLPLSEADYKQKEDNFSEEQIDIVNLY